MPNHRVQSNRAPKGTVPTLTLEESINQRQSTSHWNPAFEMILDFIRSAPVLLSPIKVGMTGQVFLVAYQLSLWMLLLAEMSVLAAVQPPCTTTLIANIATH